MVLIEVSRRLSRALSGCITCAGRRCAAICEGRRPSHLRLVTYQVFGSKGEREGRGREGGAVLVKLWRIGEKAAR